MNIFKRIFATPEIMKKTVEGIYDGLDKAMLTKEESQELWIKYLEATAPQNLARRWIAILVTVIWSVFALLYMVCVFFAPLTVTEHILSFATIYVMPPFTLITSWYFWKGVKDRNK